MTEPKERDASYAGAGVDIAAGERAVDLIRAAVARIHPCILTSSPCSRYSSRS